MKALLDALQSIADIIFNIGEFIFTIVKNTQTAMTTIVQVASESMELVNNLPTFIQTFATITVIISITYLLLGWNAGRSE